MIIIKISGGLGNQLFQYAFARALQSKRGLAVTIDISSFNIAGRSITERQFLLSKFNIKLPIATAKDFRKIGVPFPTDHTFGENVKRVIFKIKESLSSKEKKKLVVHHDLVFSEKMFEVSDNTYVSGVWTNQDYFIDIKEQIIGDLTLRDPLSLKAQSIDSLIHHPNSVSVHIRRGDYLKYAHKFKILSEEYYMTAIKLIEGKASNPSFFIFSDDIEYVKNHYADIFGANATYVSNQGIADHEELWLMSRCQNNILANSTFSWWSGWLNQNPNKIVIAPKEYRNDNKATDGLFLKEWIMI